MQRWLVCLFVVSAAACASPQRLSASIYAHEERARQLDAQGEHAAAASQRQQAEHERERLGATRSIVVSRDSW